MPAGPLRCVGLPGETARGKVACSGTHRSTIFCEGNSVTQGWRVGTLWGYAFSMFARICIGALTVVAAMSLASCGATTESPSAGPTTAGITLHRLVGADEFATAVAESDRVTINVHVPFEGDIAGTDLSIPFDRIAEQADRLPADRTVPIAIYCRTGPMSATAAEALRSLGYTDVVELQGGMKAWQASGRPLVGG
jgi:rhodanese-related sulfurtransferase